MITMYWMVDFAKVMSKSFLAIEHSILNLLLPESSVCPGFAIISSRFYFLMKPYGRVLGQ